MASSKKTSKKLPKSLRKGGLPRPVSDVWAAGVGALAQARKTSGASFEALVALGTKVSDTGSQSVQAALEQVEAAAGQVIETAGGLADGAAGGVQGRVEGIVEAVLSRLGVPGRDEVLALRQQVDALRDRLAALAETPAPVRAPTRSSTATATRSITAAVPTSPDPASRNGSAESSQRTVYRVEPHERGWAIQRVGAERATSVHATKKEATHDARQTARAHAPSRLVVCKADGTVGTETDYEA